MEIKLWGSTTICILIILYAYIKPFFVYRGEIPNTQGAVGYVRLARTKTPGVFLPHLGGIMRTRFHFLVALRARRDQQHIRGSLKHKVHLPSQDRCIHKPRKAIYDRYLKHIVNQFSTMFYLELSNRIYQKPTKHTRIRNLLLSIWTPHVLFG